MVKCDVLFEVGTELLNSMKMNVGFRGLIKFLYCISYCDFGFHIVSTPQTRIIMTAVNGVLGSM
jgi:hypothetical protein